MKQSIHKKAGRSGLNPKTTGLTVVGKAFYQLKARPTANGYNSGPIVGLNREVI